MLSVQQVLKHYKMAVHQTIGDELSCLCPFHNDHNPSLNINSESGFWICRSGCGGGNLIQFVAKKEKVDFATAELLLNNDFSEIINDKVGHTLESLHQSVAINDAREPAAADQAFVRGFINTIFENLSRLPVTDTRTISDWMKVLIYAKSDTEPHTQDDYFSLYREFLKDAKLMRETGNVEAD
jgi:hypothetical protein